MPVAEPMTVEQFLALPDMPDQPRTQLIEGELVVDPPLPHHQWLQGELYYLLSTWVRAGEGRGWVWYELGVQLDQRNFFRPDLLWYPEGGSPGVYDRPPSPLPHLAVEVRSPSTGRYDIGAKKAAYEGHGLRELWLVDTAARAVLVFRRSSSEGPGFDVALELDTGSTLTSPLLAGFTLPLAGIFPPG